jgi:hypothetical protein
MDVLVTYHLPARKEYETLRNKTNVHISTAKEKKPMADLSHCQQKCFFTLDNKDICKT